MRLTHLVCSFPRIRVITPLAAQSPDQMSYAAMASSKFMTLPVLPACMTFSAQRGDPMKGPACC